MDQADELWKTETLTVINSEASAFLLLGFLMQNNN